MSFFKRYTGAWAAAVVVALIGFFAISSSDQYGSLSARVWNGVGAAFTFGAITFTIGWLVTRIARRAPDEPDKRSGFVGATTPPHSPAVGAKARQGVFVPRSGNASSGGVFISYRRDDEPSFAGRLYDRLSQEFGESHVFMDVDSIELGLDFVHVIDAALSQCEILLTVIGADWLAASDGQGRPRLQNPNDYVRLEIQAALNRNIRVIPILVDGVQMPTAVDLPTSLQPLARRNGLPMSSARFRGDVESLAALLRRLLGRNLPPGYPS